MTKMVQSFLRDESGATAVEYGLIAALVSVAAIAAMTLLGQNLDAIFNYIAGKLTPPAG